MDRRKALKNIGTALGLPLIPLGLMAKEDETAKHYQAGLDALDMDAEYLNHMYTHDFTIQYDLASEPEKDNKKWENGFLEDFNGEIKPWEN